MKKIYISRSCEVVTSSYNIRWGIFLDRWRGVDSHGFVSYVEGFISCCSMIKVGVLLGFLSLREREHRDDIQPDARVLNWRTSMRRWRLGRVAFKGEGICVP